MRLLTGFLLLLFVSVSAGTASSSLSSAAAVSGEPGSNGNPLALGSEFVVEDWHVTVDSVDTDAWPEIQAANTYNDPPAAGRQYVMFHVTATYTGEASGDPGLGLNWSIVSSTGNSFGSNYEDYCGAIPDALTDQGELFPGATATGNVCVSVASEQVAGALIAFAPFLSDAQVFIVLEPGQGAVASPPVATAAPNATPAGSAAPGSRGNPLALGTQITLTDWSVTVDSVDTDAWPEIQAENQFNDPPAAGHQFVMFHVSATYNGDTTGKPTLDLSWTIVGSRGNTFGASLNDYCGSIPDALSDQGDQGEIAPGATAVGNECVSVPIDQLAGAVIQIKQAFGEQPWFVALE